MQSWVGRLLAVVLVSFKLPLCKSSFFSTKKGLTLALSNSSFPLAFWHFLSKDLFLKSPSNSCFSQQHSSVAHTPVNFTWLTDSFIVFFSKLLKPYLNANTANIKQLSGPKKLWDFDNCTTGEVRFVFWCSSFQVLV